MDGKNILKIVPSSESEYVDRTITFTLRYYLKLKRPSQHTYNSLVCFIRVFRIKHSTNLIKLNLRYES
jgi:hypothetical protein